MNQSGRCPEEFSLMARDQSKEFQLWINNFEDYVSLLDRDYSATQKKALLLNCAGLAVRRLVEGLNISKDPDEYDGLKTALVNYFCPSTSLIFERHQFQC